MVWKASEPYIIKVMTTDDYETQFEFQTQPRGHKLPEALKVTEKNKILIFSGRLDGGWIQKMAHIGPGIYRNVLSYTVTVWMASN